MVQNGAVPPGIGPPKLTGNQIINQTVTASHAGVPAYLIIHDKGAVGIGGPKLSEILSLYHKAGVEYVEVVVVVDGQVVLADCKINVRRHKQRGKTYMWAYPLQPAQAFLREVYRRYRGEAPRRARKPMPVLILALRPK